MLARAIITAALLIALSQPSPLMAATADEVEALYDRSGDLIVDAADWKKLSGHEQRDYVQASLNAFSTHNTPANTHRVQLYLDAINSLYYYK